MKLIIQIPCYNEKDTLPRTLADLPRHIPGIDQIEIQVIDDGSTDGTPLIAKSLGVHHIVTLTRHRGLAKAFKAGVDNALLIGADILVNTDADNQYCAADIPKLVRSIIDENADVVIGCRPIDRHPDFSLIKKALQKFGSWILRRMSHTVTRDAASGFRAYSKDALLQIHVYSQFSYCAETLIQAGYNNLMIVDVDIRINPKTRESRLFRNTLEYIWKQGKTIVAIFILYKANVFFNIIAVVVFILAALLSAGYVYLTAFHGTSVKLLWPLIIFSAALFVIAAQIFFAGILASLISSLRRLAEDSNYRVKKIEIREQEKK